jgi:hypothetical protein
VRRFTFTALLLVYSLLLAYMLIRGLRLGEFRSRWNRRIDRYESPISYWLTAASLVAVVVWMLWMALLVALGKMAAS